MVTNNAEYSRAYYAANKGRLLAGQKAYSKRPEVRLRRNSADRAARRVSPEAQVKALLKAAKERSAVHSREFSISMEDLLPLPTTCPLLGPKIVYNAENKVDAGPSIDRKDSALGYVPGNVWIVSNRANFLKNNATVEELKMITQNLTTALNKEVTS